MISFHSSFITLGPPRPREEVVKLGIVGVNVVSYHAQVQQFLIGLLFLSHVCEGGSESVLKFHPESFFGLGKVLWWEKFSFEGILLFFCPIVDLQSSDK